MTIVPAILAPAGDRDSFLAALAAGADAVYCGLKRFSARMAARNTTLAELQGLTELAHAEGAAVYVPFNVLIKPDEIADTGRLLASLVRHVRPDGLIVQDLAAVELARKAEFEGEIHLSTLANVTFPAALDWVARQTGIDRVVLPRELSIDEVKSMAAACPPGLSLELFVHGALCYAVSGRCYWSSFLGGKSGLRGRCVQPCRRRYRQADREARYFSCQDLSLDVLAKVAVTIPNIAAWKIEGRKKGPHYVYYTVRAYRMLRDEGRDPKAKRTALELLQRALGRPGTHYRFLPQRPQTPTAPDRDTGSGLLVGRLRKEAGRSVLKPREALLRGDVLRMGYEDDRWHTTVRLQRAVPKGGRYLLKLPGNRTPPEGAPAFLVDRREPALEDRLADLAGRLRTIPEDTLGPVPFQAPVWRGRIPRRAPWTMTVVHRPAGRFEGLWLSSAAVTRLPAARCRPVWWWLPPVAWPDDEKDWIDLVSGLYDRGARRFVLNAPWQAAWFAGRSGCTLWAGPFCNAANPAAITALARAGLAGVIVSPELDREALLALPGQSRLPLGVLVKGLWPLCIARTRDPVLEPQRPFVSPKGETAWAVDQGADTWIYPNWELDLTRHAGRLEAAGYRLQVRLKTPIPAEVEMKPRPGEWNWSVPLR